MNLVEKILRMKIYDSMYWKEHCFALTAESLVDKAVDINSLGGTFGGGRKPTQFICLVLKLLQIQPDKEIIVEFIKNDEYKYVRVLGAFYMRLVGRPLEIYNYLEPLYNDYRKLRMRDAAGTYSLSHVDQVVDDMLTQQYLFDIAMPRLPSRIMLERAGQLEPWISALDDQFKEQQLLEEAEQAEQEAQRVAADTQREARNTDRLRLKSHHYDGSRRRSRSRERDRERRRRSSSRDREDRGRHRNERERDRTYDRDREAERDRDSRKRRRSRSPSRERRREPGGGKSRRTDPADVEIQLANEERAKLGLKPLR